MKFRYTILYVKDVKTTLDFYVAAFGMTQKMIHESGGYGELDTGTTILGFASIEGMSNRSAVAADPKAPCFELAFETDDVTAGINHAVKAGAKLVQSAEDMPWGQTIGYVSDPDGFLVEICTPIVAL